MSTDHNNAPEREQRIAEYVAQIVDAAPELTPKQRDTIRRALRAQPTPKPANQPQRQAS